MEETRNEFGERVVKVENAEEFLAAVWRPDDEGEYLIDAPEGMAESLGFTDIAPLDA